MRKYLFLAIISALFFSCNEKVMQNQEHADDDIYSEAYLMELAYREPEEALRLTEEAEENSLLKPYQINVIKGIIYHNAPQYYLSQFY